MSALKLLSDLVQAADAFDGVHEFRGEVEGQAPSPEQLKYWEALDRAKDYLKKANATNDDLGGS